MWGDRGGVTLAASSVTARKHLIIFLSSAYCRLQSLLHSTLHIHPLSCLSNLPALNIYQPCWFVKPEHTLQIWRILLFKIKKKKKRQRTTIFYFKWAVCLCAGKPLRPLVFVQWKITSSGCLSFDCLWASFIWTKKAQHSAINIKNPSVINANKQYGWEAKCAENQCTKAKASSCELLLGASMSL